MFYQTEEKMQAWRALAIMADRSERLIYVGRSTSHVREGYVGAFMELLDDEERAQVQSISLQCWHGAADRGYWVPKTTLSIPGLKVAASQPGPRILPFRKPEALLPEVESTTDQEEETPKRLATTA
jgi:hypothetical protein